VLDLSRLSAEQRAVVLAPDGPLLVVAGPGSGKTAVLTGRVAHLVVARAVPPERVLALAFTAAAARELRARLTTVLGDRGAAVRVSTFHALGLRLVRDWSQELGFGAGPLAVYAEEEARALLREAAADAGVDPARWPPLLLQAAVARHRLADEGPPDPAIAAVAEAYEELLRRRRAVDFPAMLALPLRLLREVPRALRLQQGAHHTVLVDEFQDLCRAQYELVRLLAAEHRRLTVVGDPMQSIVRRVGAHQIPTAGRRGPE
jgi:DNA helicase-2/ATP-dependent DNA helicase PcrA